MTLPPNVHHWPPDAKAEYEERAGIMEFDGKLPSSVAEREAEALIRREWAQKEARKTA